jgi:aldose 1-epimerase
VLYPQPGYPFSLGISIEYALSDSGLQVRTTATNLGTDPCPYGSGAHPYLTLGTAAIDHLILRVPGRTVLRSDERGLPIGTEAVEHTEFNFQKPRRIGPTKLDHAFTDLERDEDGPPIVGLLRGVHEMPARLARRARLAGGLGLRA